MREARVVGPRRMAGLRGMANGPRRASDVARVAAVARHGPCAVARAPGQRLFEALRAGQLGVSFRRQVPLLGRFIADFLAAEVRLVVEVDGLYHARREAAAGYHVLRLDGELVMADVGAAVARVAAEGARILRN